TRLAARTAAGLAGDFADGVFFVSLVTVRDPHLVIPSVVQALGLTETGSQPLLATLSDWLRRREVLLVLDNFEQVLEAAPTVGSLLDACPEVAVLATSREPLSIRSEHVMEVSPLP